MISAYSYSDGYIRLTMWRRLFVFAVILVFMLMLIVKGATVRKGLGYHDAADI